MEELKDWKVGDILSYSFGDGSFLWSNFERVTEDYKIVTTEGVYCLHDVQEGLLVNWSERWRMDYIPLELPPKSKPIPQSIKEIFKNLKDKFTNKKWKKEN